MLLRLSPPITESSYILDNACGSGIVTEEVKLQHSGARIMATDLSSEMINEVKQRIQAGSWNNVETETLDVRNLSSIQDNTFTHVFTNLGLPVPGDLTSSFKVTAEIFRVLKPGGVALISTWAGMFH